MIKKASKKFALTIVVSLLTSFAFAQFSGGGSSWKRDRIQLVGGIGGTFFLGELGGRDEVGANFIFDLELGKTKPNLAIGGKYFLLEDVAARLNIVYGTIAGDDVLTAEPFRRKRNLHFRSRILEVSLLGEYSYQKPYNRKSVKARYKGKGKRFNTNLIFSGFLGVGMLNFNPEADFEGKWVKLQPLGTEGQNISDSLAPYQLTTMVIPMGASVKKPITKELSVFLEVNHRFTFTDYLDDVSGLYYDNDLILNTGGEVAAYLADPSLDFLVLPDGEVVVANTTRAGVQRGDRSDNDSYFTVNLGVTYKMKLRKIRRKRGRSGRGRF